MSVWLECQRLWLQLQPVCVTPELGKHLPVDFRKFADIVAVVGMHIKPWVPKLLDLIERVLSIHAHDYMHTHTCLSSSFEIGNTCIDRYNERHLGSPDDSKEFSRRRRKKGF